MLFSELEERGRRFKLALRAAIPILILIALIFYSTFFKGEIINLSIENNLLIAAIIFITVYFIYFFLERSAKESMIDSVTQGFTEKAFIDNIEKKKPKTLMLLVIDNLYLINENYSTQQVNLMLYTFTRKLNLFLQQNGEKEPLIARRYGAQFLIGLRNHTETIEEIIDRFIEKNSTIDNIELDYRYALITNSDHNFEKSAELLKSILVTNQNKRKDHIKESIKDSKDLSEIEQSVINAMKNSELVLSFRPILNLHTNTIDTYEIAAKLKNPSKEDILPRIYLPIINRIGMGREYDLIFVKHILKILPLIDERISLTFNLSPFSLRDKNFQDKFFNLLDETEVDASRLIIQLYERKTHHNLSGYLRTLGMIRSHGVKICIDNFGSSNASMEYMKHFKFDMIQFDRDYVTKLNDKTTFAMLESLIHMSKELNITTVAKWVDKEDQKEKLKALGVDYLQGFGISKPIDEYQLIEQYNKGNQ